MNPNSISKPVPVPIILPPIPSPTSVVYTIPAYMFIFNKTFELVPNYTNFLKTNEYYGKFNEKTSVEPIDEQISSLPFIILKKIIEDNIHNSEYFSILIKNSISKDLLVLLSLLTNQTNNFKNAKINKNDMIKNLEVSSTKNYYNNGIGFGTGDYTTSVWSINFTSWKVKTEKAHILLVFKIFESLIDAIKLHDDEKREILIDQIKKSCLISCILNYIKSSSSKFFYNDSKISN
jgi:hypothetical protein